MKLRRKNEVRDGRLEPSRVLVTGLVFGQLGAFSRPRKCP